MSFSTNSEGRATLVRSYRNLSVREIRARLEGSLGDAERVTAQAELLRRGADDGGPDTAFVTGFAPTSTSDIGAIESESEPPGELPSHGVVSGPSWRVWPLFAAVLLGVAGALAWAMHAKLIRL